MTNMVCGDCDDDCPWFVMTNPKPLLILPHWLKDWQLKVRLRNVLHREVWWLQQTWKHLADYFLPPSHPGLSGLQHDEPRAGVGVSLPAGQTAGGQQAGEWEEIWPGPGSCPQHCLPPAITSTEETAGESSAEHRRDRLQEQPGSGEAVVVWWRGEETSQLSVIAGPGTREEGEITGGSVRDDHNLPPTSGRYSATLPAIRSVRPIALDNKITSTRF